MVDLKGNFSNLVLYGAASIANGELDVDNNSTYAIANGYSGPVIGEKTLISWVSIDNLSVFDGSVLTIDKNSADYFDGIVYGEREDFRWMAGSSGFSRTQDASPGYAETTINTLVKMAITYENSGGSTNVKIYRNDVLIGNYTQGTFPSWSPGDTHVMFGRRHGANGQIDMKIEEARIYNIALTPTELATVNLYSPPPAVPLSNWSLIFTIIGIGILLFWRFRKIIIS